MSRSQQYGGSRGGGKVVRGSRRYDDQEHQLQVSIISWTEWQGLQWPELESIYHIRNEGKRSVQGHMKASDAGLKTGMPDLCLPVRGRGYWERFNNLFCELKRPGKRPTAKQVEKMQLLSRYGNFCFATDSFDVAVAMITEYLGYSEGKTPLFYIANDFFVLEPEDNRFQQGQLFEELPY